MHTRLHKKGLGNRLECGRANKILYYACSSTFIVWFPCLRLACLLSQGEGLVVPGDVQSNAYTIFYTTPNYSSASTYVTVHPFIGLCHMNTTNTYHPTHLPYAGPKFTAHENFTPQKIPTMGCLEHPLDSFYRISGKSD